CPHPQGSIHINAPPSPPSPRRTGARSKHPPWPTPRTPPLVRGPPAPSRHSPAPLRPAARRRPRSRPPGRPRTRPSIRRRAPSSRPGLITSIILLRPLPPARAMVSRVRARSRLRRLSRAAAQVGAGARCAPLCRPPCSVGISGVLGGWFWLT
ncbi:hypothetical protein F5B20DRAFT_594057, partial [Whalleya microplaca]